MGNFIAFIADYTTELILRACIFIATKLGKPKTAEKLKKAQENRRKKLEKRDLKYVQQIKKDQEEIKKLEKEQKND